MVASIGEPFLLSSYYSHRRASPTAPSPSIYVTHERSNGSKAKEGFATVTVHGDGVHVFDLSDLHISGSYTLGPATTFAGPSVSRIVAENGTRPRRIYAVLGQSPGVRSEDHGRTVWTWDDKQAFEDNAGAQEKKSSYTAPQRVSRIYASEDIPDCVIILSTNGDVNVLDIDLISQKGEWKSPSSSPLFASYIFPKGSATFLHANPVVPLATLVLLFSSASVIQVCVLCVYRDEVTTALDESIAIDGIVIEASCSASGYISCLQSDGRWRSFALVMAPPSSLSLRPMSSPLKLAGLAFTQSTPDPAALHRNPRVVSILSLGTSLVLLCSRVAHSQDLVLLLWDLRYSVVLASHLFPIPVKISTSKGDVSLELIPASNAQALLWVSSGPLDKAQKECSAVLVVPVTAPVTSTIANAMGRASSSAKWLAKSDVHPDDDSPILSFDPDRRDLLNKLKAAIQQNNPKAADTSFFEWLENHLGSASTLGTQSVKQADPLFGREFIREILSIGLQSPSRPTSPLYPVKTIHHLLENRVVSASMLSQSLLGLFAESKDWRAIELTFRNVPDLPEAEMIKLLRSAWKNSQSSDSLNVQVDATSSDTPMLPSILAACVAYPTSDAALRIAIREQLNYAEAILPILAILDEWLVKLSSLATGLILDANVAGNDCSAVVPTLSCSGGVKIPPLDKLLGFLRAILDATYVTLLQHTPSHQLLRRLAAHLQSELSVIDELQFLHGPLGLFAKTMSEKQRPPAQVEDWRRRRKLAHERASMGVGLYQVEELVI